MLKGKIFAVSALLLTAAMPAIAQDTNTNDPMKDPLKLEDQGGMKEMPADSAQAPVDTSGFVVAQNEGQWLANDYVGQSAYSADGQAVGEIDDLIIGRDGKVSGVTIAVGGFLGLGQRTIAVPFENIQQTQDENGDTKLVLAVSAEALDTAPEFMTLRAQKLEEERMKAAQEAEQQSVIKTDPSQ